MATISSANSILILTITSLFPSPVQLQGFGPDEIYGIDDIAAAESSMGVDGILSAGFVFTAIHQMITFQADSTSPPIFDTWYAQEIAQKDKFVANGSVTLPSTGIKYTLTRGFLQTYSPIPAAGRTLRPRRFGIMWNTITPSPIAAL